MISGEDFLRLEKQLQQRQHMTAAQAHLLVTFKRGFHHTDDLNDKIRRKELSEDDLAKIRDLDAALYVMPAYTEKKAYRFIRLIPSQIQKAIKFFAAHLGKTIRFPDFLSCSKFTKFTGDLVMQINLAPHTSCRDMHTFWEESGVPDPERKVAFTCNSCFKVIEVQPKGEIYLMLQEIPFDDQATEVPFFQ